MPVTAATVTSTGTLASVPGEVLGIQYRSTASAGSVVLKDGGSGGATKITLNTPAGVGHLFVAVGGGGLRFITDIHATLTNVDSVTVIYQ